nr:hypothetical protein [Tanacetum cinerariifolium]
MSAKRTAWNEFSSSMASAVICLATVDDLSSHNTKYTSLALTQKVFANIRMIGKGFSGVDTPLFDGGCMQTGGEITELDVVENVTLEDVDTEVPMDADVQRRGSYYCCYYYYCCSQVPKASAPRKKRGVVIQDHKETATASVIVHSEVKFKDKGNGILIEEPKPLKRQAQIEQDKAFARQLEAELNANINWNDV